ncbi:MAG: hypothetical protein ACI9EF_001719 [Pseudohongiellaceae bacterium]|jgi:hypothetical protein
MSRGVKTTFGEIQSIVFCARTSRKRTSPHTLIQEARYIPCLWLAMVIHRQHSIQKGHRAQGAESFNQLSHRFPGA